MGDMDERAKLEIAKLVEDIERSKFERRTKKYAIIGPVVLGIFSLPYTIPKAYKELREVCAQNVQLAGRASESGRFSINEIPFVTQNAFVRCSWLFPSDALLRGDDIRSSRGVAKVAASDIPAEINDPGASSPKQPDVRTTGITKAEIETRVESASPAATAATVGWVAVGFLPNDSLFKSETGKPLSALGPKDRLIATTSVNLRRGAADWTAPLAVVRPKQTVEIVRTELLQTGPLVQLWAEVKLSP